MTLEQIRESLPGYAKDQKLNLSSVLQQHELSEQQSWGVAAACAMACPSKTLREAVLREAAGHLSAEALESAKAAAAVMGMNNVYYRFLHLASDEKYRTIPARLRMNVIRTHGGDPLDFELCCLAVSAIHGCGACVDSHSKVLIAKGIKHEAVIAGVRIAAVMHAVSSILEAEGI